ncbi:restriction endonuclease subunit S [Ideonella paludis]|uniref:Restriction endonuclease subunit S n=1 Tax=Ideonella paludis TaxID=1233411 RepID=A0ABS5DWE4_9BURK|nr:restriction endonuclease subunit S [Ideonella paludis]MBQ0935465.1 restriction endonuclease subunit S [Ideonella paludis]
MTMLNDVADMLVGFAFKSAGFLDEDADGPRLVRGDNVQQGYLRWGDKTKRWSSADLDGLERYQLAEGDVLLAMDRPIVGDGLKMAWVTQDDLPAMLVQRVCRLRGKPGIARTEFLRYVLSAPDFSAHIHRVTTGANIPHISGRDIGSYEFELPPLSDQDSVAHCLKAYDDLIATNQRRIALLEQAARLLYREWFVQLRFPGHESVRVKLGVPEGWRMASIAEQASFLNRGIAPKYDDTAKGWVINQKCIRDGRISMAPARRQSKDVKPDRLVRLGDVLINSTGAGTLGRVAQVRSHIDDCTVDTHVTIVRPSDSDASAYLGQALLNLEPVFSDMGKGATNQLELNRADIGDFKIWLPPEHVRVEFHRLIWPMLDQAEQLNVAILSLQKARDLLLPKLMSGQLDVSRVPLPEEAAA